MKRIKQLAYLLLIVQVVSFHACTDDDDPDPVNSDNRDDFVGLWSVQETSSIFGTSVYDSEIQKNSAVSANIAIDNFYQLGVDIITQAEVDGNQLTIPIQTISGQVIQGSGILVNNSTIEFTFTANDGADTDSVTSVYNKK